MELMKNWPIELQNPTMESIFPIYQVDAFTQEPFKGNPAAVCSLMAPRSEEWMQNVAIEMNLSETAFFAMKKNGHFSLRWFTPGGEVDLCGHATLATAHIIWQSQLLREDEPIRFDTLSGTLTARKSGDKIELDFPDESPQEGDIPDELLEMLGIAPVWTGKNRMDYLIEFPDAEMVLNFEPDFRALSKIETRGLIVTARSDNGKADFISRFFAPAFGVDEDPVTGSAHCCLGPFWAKKLNKKVLIAYQASPRGGYVEVEPLDKRVLLRGHAVTVMQGVISA